MAFDKNSIADRHSACTATAELKKRGLRNGPARRGICAIRERGPLFEMLYDNPCLPAQCLVFFCFVFFYYFLSWQRLGIDPPKGAIFPRYYPPQMRSGPQKSGSGATPQTLSPLAVEFRTSQPALQARGLPPHFWSLLSRGCAASVRRTIKPTRWNCPPEATGRKGELSAEEQAVPNLYATQAKAKNCYCAQKMKTYAKYSTQPRQFSSKTSRAHGS